MIWLELCKCTVLTPYRECTRGGFCNFMHLKPISRELRRELYGRRRKGYEHRLSNSQKGSSCCPWTGFIEMYSSSHLQPPQVSVPIKRQRQRPRGRPRPRQASSQRQRAFGTILSFKPGLLLPTLSLYPSLSFLSFYTSRFVVGLTERWSV